MTHKNDVTNNKKYYTNIATQECQSSLNQLKWFDPEIQGPRDETNHSQ